MERIILSGLVALVCVGLISTAHGNEIVFEKGQERIVRDTQTGEYVIEYIGDDGTLRSVRWMPAMNAKVSVRSKFTRKKDYIAYRYTITNDKDSLQPVLAFKILVRNDTKEENMSAPANWQANMIENFDDPSAGRWADWTVRRAEFSLSPGESVTGVEMMAKELPGVGTALVRGLMSVLTYPDEGPGGEMIKFMEQGGFLRKASEGISVTTAVPKIPVSDPFDAGVVLANLQKHLKDDIVSMQLIDPVFATQLDRYLQGAIDAAKAGNTTGVKGNLKDFRRLLKSEHDDPGKDDDWDKDDDDKSKDKPKKLIDKLAARVLDFDAKYVLKRIGD